MSGCAHFAGTDAAWMAYAHWAIDSARRATLEILAQTPMQVLRGSSSKSDDAYYRYVEALQALWLNSEDSATNDAPAPEKTLYGRRRCERSS